MALQSLNLSVLNGNNGFALTSPKVYRFSFGFEIGDSGDVNGDGIDDFTFVTPRAIANQQGFGYVIFGQKERRSQRLNVATLNGQNGFAIKNTAFRRYTLTSVNHAGDINGDGIGDLILVGTVNENNSSAALRQGYVVWGRHEGFAAELDLAALDGTTGFQFTGIRPGDIRVSRVGDVNGDRLEDVVVSAPGTIASASPGQSIVVFGRDRFDARVDLSTLRDQDGLMITGIRPGERLGEPVRPAGDVNGDGVDDLIVGAFGRGQVQDYTGEGYVIFGQRSSGDDVSIQRLNVAELDGRNGFAMQPIVSWNDYGYVNGAGDVNGDGIDDVVVGAPFANRAPNQNNQGFRAGQAYVVFGDRNPFPAQIDPLTLNGRNGFIITGSNAYDQAGALVSPAGDINGDGVDDLLITGAEGYVVFGNRQGFSSALNLEELNGKNGFGINFAGRLIRSVGDVNGDGLGDLMLGNVRPGEQSHSFIDRWKLDHRIIFGGGIYGTDAADVLTGLVQGSPIYGFAGDDCLTGSTGADTLVGGAGQDELIGGMGDDVLTGEGSRDILTGGGGGDRFVFALGRKFRQEQMGIDRVTDFTRGEDQIVLQSLTFTRLRGRSVQFRTVQNLMEQNLAKVQQSKALILYNRQMGELFYNENGVAAGWGKGGSFAVLSNLPRLTTQDLVISW
jgi:Ca2+-binding RTX toxin-like protein